ncbi:hypothetical protein AHAS_Ahas01G0128900 [Arachis hypogaea]
MIFISYFQRKKILSNDSVIDEERKSNYSEKEACTIKKSITDRPSRRFSDRIHRGKNDLDQAQITDVYNYRFQEIVPLVAGNIFGTEDNGPARKWIALVNKTLNSLLGTRGGCHTPLPFSDPIIEIEADFEGSMRQKTTSLLKIISV